MTYVDDLYEAGDDREPEPEPDERDEQPVDLDQIEALYRVYLGDDNRVSLRAAIELGRFTGALLDELRAARERLARWEALPTTDEWAVTDDRSTPPRDGLRFTADAALAIAARDGRQAWRQTRISRPAVIRPWEPIDADSPF